MNIITGMINSAQKVVIYGPEGIGKSTLASYFPNPVFIDTEGSTKRLNVARTPKPSSWTMLMEQIKYFRDAPKTYQTLVIDTADWAERLCVEHICSKSQKSGIEDFGYGKGYTYLEEEFGRFLNLLEEVVERGINIVVTAHASLRKFEQPDELGSYDRWELKLEKKTAPLLKEWADMVLFANFKTYVINVDGQGAQKGKNKAQGGKRVMYTTHHSCWDAKNRHDLPEEIPMEYKSIAHCIPGTSLSIQTMPSQPSSQITSVQVEKESVITPVQEQSERRADPVQSTMESKKTEEEKTDDVPPKLLDLMKNCPFQVYVSDIQEVVELRGYYPKGTPIKNYDPGFIEGVLVGAWDKIVSAIREQKLSRGEFVDMNVADEMPFN